MTEHEVKNTVPPSALRQIEAAQHRSRQSQHDSRGSCHGWVCPERDERYKAEHRKHELRCGLHKNIDDDARNGQRGRYPRNVNSRAPMMSPPTWVSGRRVLTASRTNLKRTAARRCKCPLAERRNHQPAPAMETVTARVNTTSGTPQPTLAIALPTSSMPDQTARPMQAAIPAHQATAPICFSAPIPALPLDTTAAHRSAEGPRVDCISYRGNCKTDSKYPINFTPHARNWCTLCLPTPHVSTNLTPDYNFPISPGGRQCAWRRKRGSLDILRRGDARGTHPCQISPFSFLKS